ncbi:MAG TPA: 2-C-methyl-D-erythritol 4-phosphate cytidylyltransferase [Pseudonocardiaceae bacterium]|nr:2-C-methyl-D-erythritol 4-phosphate cytidylyltransferase [Pseudonocardiaceae bacterium]
MRPARVVALVPAAGQGVRLGAGTAKAFVSLRGRPLLWHAVQALLASGGVERVVVAVRDEYRQRAQAALCDLRPQGDLRQQGDGVPRVDFVVGGEQRSDSVRHALDAVPDAEVVLVHDAARCLTPVSVIRAVVDAVLAGHRAVVPVLPVVDTIKQVDPEGQVVSTVDRSTLRVVQTPQGFAADLLRLAHRQPGAPVTDDAGLVERLGEPVATVPGHPHAFKITTPFDLLVAESLAGRLPCE